MHKSCIWPHDRIHQETDSGDILYVTERYKDIDTYILNNGPTLFCLEVEQKMHHVSKQDTWESIYTTG